MLVPIAGLVASGLWFVVGTQAGADLRRDPHAFRHAVRFVAVLLLIQGTLSLPVLVRYLWPRHLRKVGIE
jgi:hypothetical protein